MVAHISSRLQRYAVIAAALLALSACAGFGNFFAQNQKHPVKTVQYDALSFVEHLALAKVALDNNGSATPDDARVIDSYTKQKKAKARYMFLVVIDYKDGEGNSKRAIAPVSEKGNLSALSEVLAALDGGVHTFKDIRVMGVSVSPAPPMKITGKDPATTRQEVDKRYEAILANARKIPAVEEAKMQLKLLRYFMDAQKRDAAYICADNLKRILSAATQNGADAATVDQLSKDLEIEEGKLRQTMPY